MSDTIIAAFLIIFMLPIIIATWLACIWFAKWAILETFYPEQIKKVAE
jgi:hypothetical protein